jgi:N-acetyl-1-D-myo-inositol-2-amino-2-deoxy-alpha-D-glucopyranoside deacetylase
MGPLLAIFPHPDDETFTSAGTLAAAVARDVPVTVVSATRGEAGESSILGLDDPERLGEVREQELRDAMRYLGVTDVRFLGHRDSGMEGSSEALHPRAFVRVPVDAVAATLATLIRDLQPQTILTFGPEGMYGHPDHLHMHHAAVRAVALAADVSHQTGSHSDPWPTPALYFGTFPREEMLKLLDRPGSPLEFMSQEARNHIGVPLAEITHIVDITAWADAKRAAIAAHVTQTAEGGPLQHIPPEATERQLRREYFVRATLPWTTDELDDQDIVSVLATGN